MKTTYKGFKIGDKVISTTGNVLYSNQGNLKDNVPIETEFEIVSFPVQLTKDSNYTNYVKGVTEKGEIVTCFPIDIKKTLPFIKHLVYVNYNGIDYAVQINVSNNNGYNYTIAVNEKTEIIGKAWLNNKIVKDSFAKTILLTSAAKQITGDDDFKIRVSKHKK